MIQADPSGKFVLHVDLGLDKIFVWKFDAKKGTLTAERPARGVAAARRRPAALPLPPQRQVALLDPGGGLDGRAVRLRRGAGRLTARQTISTLPAGFAGSNFCSEILVSADGKFVYAGNRLHDSIGIFSVGPKGDLTHVGDEWTRGNYPRSFAFDPTGKFLYCCNQRADNVDRLPGGPQDRRPRLHRPVHPRRQPVAHRVPRPREGRRLAVHDCACPQRWLS